MSLKTEMLNAPGSHRIDLAALVAGIEPGKPEREYADGGNLYLLVRRTGVHTWRFKKTVSGVPQIRTIGTYEQFNELAARTVAIGYRSLALDGYSLCDRRADGSAPVVEPQLSSPVFEVFAREFVATIKKFKNDKSRTSWTRTIEATLKPLHGKQLHTITTQNIVDILKPIWCEKPTVATEARVRVAKLFKNAIAQGTAGAMPAMKGRSNPAEGSLISELMPEGQKKRGEVKGSHPCLPYAQMPAFWSALRAIDTMPSKLLQWVILTGVRASEARQTKFGQIARDVEQKAPGAQTWTIPNCKNGKAAIVPVTPLMQQLLDEMKELNRSFGHGTEADDYVFPGIRRQGMQAACNMNVLLQSTMGLDTTVHGMRATFKSYCQNETSVPDLVSEFCLHHIKKGDGDDGTWKAYARGDMWAKRKACLIEWQDYVTGAGEKNEMPMAA